VALGVELVTERSLLNGDLKSNLDGALDRDLDIVRGSDLLLGRADGSYSALLQGAVAGP
jgi:hypothetical protein